MALPVLQSLPRLTQPSLAAAKTHTPSSAPCFHQCGNYLCPMTPFMRICIVLYHLWQAGRDCRQPLSSGTPWDLPGPPRSCDGPGHQLCKSELAIAGWWEPSWKSGHVFTWQSRSIGIQLIFENTGCCSLLGYTWTLNVCQCFSSHMQVQNKYFFVVVTPKNSVHLRST